MPEAHPALDRRSLVRQGAVLLGGVFLLALLARVAPVDDGLERLREATAALGPVRAVLLVAGVYAATELALVPGSAICLLSGALLGPWLGTVAAWMGAMTSATLAFLISRHVASGAVEALAARSPRLRRVRQRMGRRGWRWVAALRLFPVVPYTVQNYVAGLTPIPLRQYLGASAVAMVPGVTLYAWTGYTGAEVVRAAAGVDPLEREEVLGLLLVAVLAAALGRSVLRRLNHRAPERSG